MNALTREALPPGARGRRRDMGELALPRALPRALGMGALRAAPSTRAPGRERRPSRASQGRESRSTQS
jgi:hypothetical protein